jgi:hypothetical protein
MAQGRIALFGSDRNEVANFAVDDVAAVPVLIKVGERYFIYQMFDSTHNTMRFTETAVWSLTLSEVTSGQSLAVA